MSTSNNVVAITIPENPRHHETQHVHAIYDQIASHFSSTRYKPWPIISAFLGSLEPGWIGLDSGTGNGKYLSLPRCAVKDGQAQGSVWMIGLDRSKNLLEIAQHAGGNNTEGVRREVVLGNVLSECWRIGVFDYAISIATIHHLATHDRRKSAVKRLLESVSPTHGRILIYVWAIEQDELSKRNVPISNMAVENGQDVFIPWVLSSQPAQKKRKGRTRRCNLSGKQDEATQEDDQQLQSTEQPQVFNRYYHMFARGELQRLVHEAARELDLVVASSSDSEHHKGIELIQDGWERSNYYVEVRCWKN